MRDTELSSVKGMRSETADAGIARQGLGFTFS